MEDSNMMYEERTEEKKQYKHGIYMNKKYLLVVLNKYKKLLPCHDIIKLMRILSQSLNIYEIEEGEFEESRYIPLIKIYRDGKKHSFRHCPHIYFHREYKYMILEYYEEDVMTREVMDIIKKNDTYSYRNENEDVDAYYR